MELLIWLGRCEISVGLEPYLQNGEIDTTYLMVSLDRAWLYTSVETST